MRRDQVTADGTCTNAASDGIDGDGDDTEHGAPVFVANFIRWVARSGAPVVSSSLDSFPTSVPLPIDFPNFDVDDDDDDDEEEEKKEQDEKEQDEKEQEQQQQEEEEEEKRCSVPAAPAVPAVPDV